MIELDEIRAVIDALRGRRVVPGRDAWEDLKADAAGYLEDYVSVLECAVDDGK